MISSLYEPFQKWARKGAVWIISDPHFADPDVKFFDDENRPTDDEMVNFINVKVGKNDTVIFLGDIGNIDYIPKIRGYKVLILGNHDSGASNYRKHTEIIHLNKNEFNEQEAVVFVKNKYPDYKISSVNSEVLLDKYDCWAIEINNGLFDEVYEGPLVISEKIILSHEPINLPFMFNIHGHVHNKKYTGDTNHLNVVAEVINYTPVNLNNLIKNGLTSKIDSIHRITIDNATQNPIKKKDK